MFSILKIIDLALVITFFYWWKKYSNKDYFKVFLSALAFLLLYIWDYLVVNILNLSTRVILLNLQIIIYLRIIIIIYLIFFGIHFLVKDAKK